METSCIRCGDKLETADHVLFDCPFARHVWFGCSLFYSPPTFPKLSDWLKQWDLIFKEDKKKDREVLSKTPFIMWYLWRARNDLCFTGKSWSPQEVIRVVEKAFLEFFSTIAPPVASEAPTQQEPSTSTSPIGVHKVNCDVAASSGYTKGGLKLIDRDHTGVQSKAVSIPHHFQSVCQGEALSIQNALTMALANGFSHLMVESDSKETTDYILDQNLVAPLVMAPILTDIWTLSHSFDLISFCYIPRAQNVVADALARKALSLMCVIDWPESTPWLHDLFVKDATGCTHTSS
ncbi:uncharacterized protein LOC122092967 [Macadamia integrifolia]|uniref:uncharacterized protein LOC122092967 n=1 Tax=Macadamia integrifolia TaxID=60698 RepID=UPI001C52B734|nr:uncharacterized protein LOC122092967 [Macadamia integrifolia]